MKKVVYMTVNVKDANVVIFDKEKNKEEDWLPPKRLIDSDKTLEEDSTLKALRYRLKHIIFRTANICLLSYLHKLDQKWL